MSRWIQHPVTHRLIPAEEYERPSEAGHFIHGDIEPFISPLDGSVVSSRMQFVDHCKKHGVVPAQEFSPEHYERKAKERERFFNAVYDSDKKFQRKQEIYNALINAERG